VERLLERDGAFVRRLAVFASRIGTPGLLTSVAQLVVKATAPGVPDFFQGTELWELSLVDPDNRRPVDFAKRRRLLDELRRRIELDRATLARELVETADDGRLKLYVTMALLAFRRRERAIFSRGEYLPLAVEGAQGDHVVAFARRWRGRAAITVTGRFFARLGGKLARISPAAWADAVVHLPADLSNGTLTDVLSGAEIRVDGTSIPVTGLFETMPFAVLVGEATQRE